MSINPEEQYAKDDLNLLAELADVLGGVQQASDFVCLAYELRLYIQEFDGLVKNWVEFNMAQKRQGCLWDHLQVMRDEEYGRYAYAQAQDNFSREIAEAEIELGVILSRLAETGQEASAIQLLATIGVLPTEKGYEFTERDEERTARILQTAKLMDGGYREFFGLNPELLPYIDPVVAAELTGRPIEDTHTRQLYNELKHEL